MAPHGTRSAYQHDGCRCDDCRRAEAVNQATTRAARAAKGVPPEMPHGLSTYVNWGCRCEVCRIDKAKRARERRTERLLGMLPHTTRCKCNQCRVRVVS